MQISPIEKIKLNRKEKKFRKLGKAIFEKAENSKSVTQIKKNLTTLLFELNDLSPKYLSVTDKHSVTLQIWIRGCLEKISKVEYLSKTHNDEKPNPEVWWTFIALDLMSIGDTINKTYFDYNQTNFKLMLPDYSDYSKEKNNKNDEKIYATKDAYKFFTDLSKLIKEAKNEIIITDGYPDEQLFEAYLQDANINVKIRLLSKQIDKKLIYISNKFQINRNGNFELRQNLHWHDRFIFIDSNCWVIGQSIKNAAVKAPTYKVKLEAYEQLKAIFETEWNNSILINEQYLKQIIDTENKKEINTLKQPTNNKSKH